MSAATAPLDLDLSSGGHVPMSRLTRVEYRKALDTRAGRWLVIGILAALLAILVIYSFAAHDDDKDFETYLLIAGSFLGYFMPIIVIMLVTSEASQRNGLVTFTLEPRRPRVVAAKFLAGLGLAVTVMVAAFLVALLGTVIGVATGGSPDWIPSGHLLFNGFILANLSNILTGFAISMLIMNTPGAIVGYFVYSLILPIAVGILSAISGWFDNLAPWIHLSTAEQPLFDGDYTPTGHEWAQIAVAAFIWLAVPLAFGIWRLLRIEFK